MTSATGPRQGFSGRLGFYLSATLLVSALVLGGRSAGTPLSEALFQILAIWLLVWMAFSRRIAADSRLSTAAIALILAMLAASLLQLLPLPYGLWSAASGAPQAAGILDMIGEGGGARSLTLDASATRGAILTLLPPIALFLAMLEMNARDRHRLAILVVVAATVSLIVGILQYASQTGSLYFYKTSHQGYSVGFFTNRNHQADLTLVGALLASALYRARSDAMPNSRLVPALIGAVGVALVIVNLVAAASRTGMALAVPALIACAGIALGLRRTGRSLALAALGVVAVGAVLVLIRPDLFSSATGRFGAEDELRFQIWPVIVDLIGQYFPFGSGLGTFVPVFATAEELNTVTERFVNHAHNDYLEIALEMGALGIVLIACFLALFAWASIRALRRADWPRAYTPLTTAAVAGILVLLAHSVVDYSLRTSTLAVTFAVLMGLLMPLPAHDVRRGSRDERDQLHG